MKIHLKLKVLNPEGVPFMGRGPVELLRGIEHLGSINQAAKTMNMSYVKAWKMIKVMENSLGGKILETKIGGRNHGGSELTPLAKILMDDFSAYEADVERFAEEQFTAMQRHFRALARRRTR
jgi:molybdate transport system regulatory protein